MEMSTSSLGTKNKVAAAVAAAPASAAAKSIKLKSKSNKSSEVSAKPQLQLQPQPLKQRNPRVAFYQAYTLSKRNGETFFLQWAVVWVSLMAYIVASGVFHEFTAWSYMYVGLFISIPPVLLPLLLPQYFDDPSLPVLQRYTTKANIWIFILSFIGNYLWTHYFYSVLGCSYTFPAHRLNDVPFALYLITHGYFHLYHTLSNMLLRSLWRALEAMKTSYSVSVIVVAVVVACVSYLTAFMETYTIQHFDYYVIPDRTAMYKIGSAFYAIYFLVSFPMFLRLDEQHLPLQPEQIRTSQPLWTIQQTLIDVMACCMTVTMICDAWRLIGPNIGLAAATAASSRNINVAWL